MTVFNKYRRLQNKRLPNKTNLAYNYLYMHICIVNAMKEQNQWRDYPGNIPAEDVLMAVEYYNKWENPDKIGPQRSCWIYIKGHWYWRDGAFLDRPVDIETKTNIRFKPW